jgi:gamma-glutamylcyclotransferase (GGCT)/AIG2-like uncharacterized protein YtfP
MRLFAYGTLMTADGFRDVLGLRTDTLAFRQARLDGWRRIWNAYREEWDGGVLNIERHPGAHVWGVVVEGLGEGDFAALDAQEATHLPRERVFVELETGESVEAETYWQRRGSHHGPVSPRYEAAVLERARVAGPRVLDSVRTASVDATGAPRRL